MEMPKMQEMLIEKTCNWGGVTEARGHVFGLGCPFATSLDAAKAGHALFMFQTPKRWTDMVTSYHQSTQGQL